VLILGKRLDVDRFLTVFFQGTSTKYSPQRVGLTHIMEHEDVIQIVKK
jgi:ribosome-interacting GTPase 1